MAPRKKPAIPQPKAVKEGKFEGMGGKVTVLSGAEKAKFDKLMADKVIPAMAGMIDADSLKAAEKYAASLN